MRGFVSDSVLRIIVAKMWKISSWNFKMKCHIRCTFWESRQSKYIYTEPYLDGGAEVVEAPGDDDVVVAAHQGGHHGGAVAHSAEARVDLHMRSVRRSCWITWSLLIILQSIVF